MAVDARVAQALQSLAPGSVRYLPGSWEKRFARSIAERASAPGFEPTERQWIHIRRLAHRYRRQAPRAHDVLCGSCAPSDAQARLL